MASLPPLVITTFGILPQLTSLTELFVDANKEVDLIVSPIFHEVWKITGKQLRSLRIQCRFENLDPIALPRSQVLTSLETFSLECTNCHYLGNSCGRTLHPEKRVPEIVSKFLFPFIIAHQSTLRYVSFQIDCMTFDVTALLHCLRGMPCLYSVSFLIPFAPIGRFPFAQGHRLLRAHQSHLRTFDLNFLHQEASTATELFPWFFGQAWCKVHLPNLRELRIGQAEFGQDFCDYLRLFSSSLVSLTIYDGTFMYDILQQLGLVLRDFALLRHLELDVYAFSPSALAVLAVNLPQLRSLKLTHYCIAFDEDKSKQNDTELYRLVRTTAYPLELNQYLILFANSSLRPCIHTRTFFPVGNLCH